MLDRLIETEYHYDHMDAIEGAVSESGRRLTGARKRVAALIGRQSGHFTAADLLSDASQSHVRVGRATLFRNLELFTELGALERLDLPTGEHAYVACEPEQHHHHVVCRSCGKSVEVEDGGLQSVVADIARRSGYRIDTHRLELFGTCPHCAGAAA
jgi:Fur family transcriptional regulator, ferric uptake regulator